MVGKACLPSNAYYLWTPDYTLYSGVHVCWSEHSDSSFVFGFMVEIDHDIFSTVILPLPLIQEGQLSVSGERMCTILVNRLED